MIAPVERVTEPNPPATWRVPSKDAQEGQASRPYSVGERSLDSNEVAAIVVADVSGAMTSQSARLQTPLDKFVARLCGDGGITCKLSLDDTGAIHVTLRNATDRQATVVLSDRGDLTKITTINTPASATYVIAGVQGDLTARTFATADSGATGADRREVFSDQSALTEPSAVQHAADATLALAAASMTIRADISEIAAERLRYLTDYDVGDIITAEIAGIRYPMPVSAVTFDVTPERPMIVRPVLGDASPDPVTGLLRDVANLQQRFAMVA